MTIDCAITDSDFKLNTVVLNQWLLNSWITLNNY